MSLVFAMQAEYFHTIIGNTPDLEGAQRSVVQPAISARSMMAKPTTIRQPVIAQTPRPMSRIGLLAAPGSGALAHP